MALLSKQTYNISFNSNNQFDSVSEPQYVFCETGKHFEEFVNKICKNIFI
jgi:hypothetical protein